MKTILAITTMILLATTGCTDSFKDIFQNPKQSAVALLYDRTDDIPSPPADDVLNVYKIDDNRKYDGFSLRCREISDIELEPVQTFDVKGATWYQSDDIERVAEIKNFKSGFSKWFTSSQKAPVIPKKHSVILKPMIDEANRLAANKEAAQRILICVSDLRENSTVLNTYSSDFELIRLHPNMVIERIEKIYPVENLTGVQVYFVYKPISYEDQLRFDACSKLFAQLLSKHHAKVYIGAQLPKQQPNNE